MESDTFFHEPYQVNTFYCSFLWYWQIGDVGGGSTVSVCSNTIIENYIQYIINLIVLSH